MRREKERSHPYIYQAFLLCSTLLKLLWFHRLPFSPLKNKISSTAFGSLPKHYIRFIVFHGIGNSDILHLKSEWKKNIGEAGKMKGFFSSKIYCGKVRNVSALCFITLLAGIVGDVNGRVFLLMWRWDNFGKAVSRNFNSVQSKGCINAFLSEKKNRLIPKLLFCVRGKKLEVRSLSSDFVLLSI